MKKSTLALVLFCTLQCVSGALFPDPWNGANLFLINAVTRGGELTEKTSRIIAAIKHGANPNLVLPIAGLGPKERSLLALGVQNHDGYDYHDFILTLARYVTEPTHFADAIAQARESAENHRKMSQHYHDNQKFTEASIAQARKNGDNDVHKFQPHRDRQEEQAIKYKKLSEACVRLANNLEIMRKEKIPR